MGSIADIKHVVILMQENRSFDEYFGTFPGATGWNDPEGVFGNQFGAGADGLDIKPFRKSTFTASGLEATTSQHNWDIFHALYNNGQNGQHLWAAPAGQTNDQSVISYHVANDIPFHWWLASTFALCDHYVCSVLGPTTPNRFFLMSGEIGLGQTACLGTYGYAGYQAASWLSYADMLTQAGVSWVVYDDAQLQSPGDGPYTQNNGGSLNVLNDFPTWSEYETSEHYVVTDSSTIFPASTPFEIAAKSGNLPAVSWILPPSGYHEWEINHPSDGAAYIATKLQAILEGSWDDTVFILIYDEYGGRFDHVRLPPPPADDPQENIGPPVFGDLNPGPIGPGMRIPAIVVSPWTVNRGVQTQYFDHGSVLQFLEQVTKNYVSGGVQCTNLSAWRRSIFGDLTSVFDFDNPVSAAEVQALFPWPQSITEFTQTYDRMAFNRLQPFKGQPLTPPTPQAFPPTAQSCEIMMPAGSYDLAQAQAVAVTAPNGTVSATFPAALKVTVIGFEPNELFNPYAMAPTSIGITTAAGGTCTTRVPTITFSNSNIRIDATTVAIDQDPSQAELFGVPYSSATLSGVPCNFTFTYDLVFENLEDIFPPTPSGPGVPGTTLTYGVNVTFQSDATFTASAELELVSTADPQFYKNFTDDITWLSGELVVFSLPAGQNMFNNTTLGDAANPTAATGADALTFINAVVEKLNNGSAPQSDFDALDAPESANPLPLAFTPLGAVPIFNFALARVHMNSAQLAKNVRVFFRCCRASVTTGAYDADTQGPASGPSYKPAFYRSNPASGPAPGAANDTKVPLLGVTSVTPPDGGTATLEYTTIPFFANPRVNVTDPHKSMADQQADGPANVRDMGVGPTVAYFGCWLDINQDQNVVPASVPSPPTEWDGPFAAGTAIPIQSAFSDLHQCIVAEISFDSVTIRQGDIPGYSAWLAQRNLALIAP